MGEQIHKIWQIQDFSRQRYKRFSKIPDLMWNVEKKLIKILRWTLWIFNRLAKTTDFCPILGTRIFYDIDLRIKCLYAKFMSIWCPLHWNHPQSPVQARLLRRACSKYFTFLTFFLDDIWIGSHFYNIHPRIKCLR